MWMDSTLANHHVSYGTGNRTKKCFLSILHGVLVSGDGCWSTQAQKRNNDRAQRRKFTHTQLHIAKCWESTCHYPWGIYPNRACLRFVYTESPLSTLATQKKKSVKIENQTCHKNNLVRKNYCTFKSPLHHRSWLLDLQVCTAPPPHDYQTFKLALHHHSCHNI
jgi:hypothetical protein